MQPLHLALFPPLPHTQKGGVLDFTGELGRLAIMQATARDEAAVARARDLVEAIMGQMLQFDLRNGSLRKKWWVGGSPGAAVKPALLSDLANPASTCEGCYHAAPQGRRQVHA